MRTRDIKALNETIASVVDPADADRAKALQEGYLNSLTEKARQVISEAVETKNEDEVEAIMKRLAAKALKKAKKKARRSSGDDAYAGINPSAAKTDPDMKNPGRVAEELIYEVAAPGMEDWASDPKVKASFKKQYGKRWKEVMYGRSWNLAKKEKELGVNEEEELDLAEGDSAKRMRVIRKHHVSGKPIKPEVADFMQRSFKKKFYKDKEKFGGATSAVLGRAALKQSAMKAKGLAEAEQDVDLAEGVSAKRMRIIRKHLVSGKPVTGKVKDFMDRSIQKQLYRDKTKFSGATPAYPSYLERARRKHSAMKAKGLAEADQLDEGKGGRSNFTNLMKRQVSRVRRAGGREDVQREIGNYTEREAAGGEGKMSYQARRAFSDANIEAKAKERDAKKAKARAAMKEQVLAEAEQLDELKVLGSVKTGFKKGGLVGAVKSGAKALKHNIKRGGIVGDTADAQLRDNFLRRATNKAIDKNSPHGTAAAARAVARVSKLKNIKGLRRRFKGAVESKFSDRTQHTVKPMIAARVAQFNAANAKKSVSEANELNEADYKKLMRLKGAAYKTRNPKVVRATAELEAKVAANMARRGGASADAIRAGGSRIGKSGKYTQKAGQLANQRDRALAKFRGRAVGGGEFNPPGPEKRKRQQAQAEFSNRARSGDFGQNNQEGMRPRYNYLKRTGKLKTYK
jgi:hypothetical protein